MEQNALGKRIKEARKNLKLTQEALAEKAKISNVYLGEIERGTKIPSVPVLVDLIEALEVSADYLLLDSLNSANVIVNNEITEKLSKLTPKQRKTALDILNAYINNIWFFRLATRFDKIHLLYVLIYAYSIYYMLNGGEKYEKFRFYKTSW